VVRLQIGFGCLILALGSFFLSSANPPWIAPALAVFAEPKNLTEKAQLTSSQVEETLRELLNNEHRLINNQIDRDFLIDSRYTASQACEGGFAFGSGTIAHPKTTSTSSSGKTMINNCRSISGSVLVEHTYETAAKSKLQVSGSIYASFEKQAPKKCTVEMHVSKNLHSVDSISSRIVCTP
jgi:hypothetical protein